MFSKFSKLQATESPMSAASSPVRSATGGRGTPFSVLGSDVVITGNISASVDLHIDGTVEGDVTCATLVQGAESHIKGHVKAQVARLAGHVEGSIAADELIVEATARIVGDVAYDRISIATGGRVEGRFTPREGAGDGGATELKLITSEGAA